MRNIQKYSIFNPFFKKFIISAALVFASVSYAGNSGVEFIDKEVEINEEAFKSFSNQLVETQYDKKKDINELRFSHSLGNKKINQSLEGDLNSQRPIYLILGQRLGQTVYKKIDVDLDGFFEEYFKEVEGKDYIFEEFLTFGEGNFYRMRRRYFPQKGKTLFKVEVAFREKKGDSFKVTGGYTYASIDAMVQGDDYHSSPTCMDSRALRLNRGLRKSIDQVINSFAIRWPSGGSKKLKVEASFESSCNSKVDEFLSSSGSQMHKVYENAINKGLTCLQGLSNMDDPENNSFSRVMYLNAVASLAGQAVFDNPLSEDSFDNSNQSFPNRVERRKMKKQQVLCSQRQNSFIGTDGEPRPGAIGMASVLPNSRYETQITCENEGSVTISHPFISLNFNMLEISSESRGHDRAERERRLEELIFHEFLHTTGVPHDDTYDPVTVCSKLCFQGSSMSEQQRTAARELCAGQGMTTLDQSSLQRRAQAQSRFMSLRK